MEEESLYSKNEMVRAKVGESKRDIRVLDARRYRRFVANCKLRGIKVNRMVAKLIDEQLERWEKSADRTKEEREEIESRQRRISEEERKERLRKLGE